MQQPLNENYSFVKTWKLSKTLIANQSFTRLDNQLIKEKLSLGHVEYNSDIVLNRILLFQS